MSNENESAQGKTKAPAETAEQKSARMAIINDLYNRTRPGVDPFAAQAVALDLAKHVPWLIAQVQGGEMIAPAPPMPAVGAKEAVDKYNHLRDAVGQLVALADMGQDADALKNVCAQILKYNPRLGSAPVVATNNGAGGAPL